MSVSINIQAFASKESKEFQKHYNCVVYCINNALSFPKETSEFFKGKVDGNDLENLIPSSILKYIQNGIEVDLPVEDKGDSEFHIKVSEIPKDVDIIVVKLS